MASSKTAPCGKCSEPWRSTIKGLCVITTRIAVDELKDRQPQVIQKELDNLQAADAVKLLKDLQVQGTDKELQAAAKEYGCHALSVSLLGNLLHRRHGGDIRKRDLIPELARQR